MRPLSGPGQIGVGAVAQRFEGARVALNRRGAGDRRQGPFGQVRILVDTGDGGPPMGDVVGAAGRHPVDLGRGVFLRRPETAARLDVLEVRPGLGGKGFGEVLDVEGPPAASSTRPRCDSSSNSSWVLRAIRRAKSTLMPGKPPGIATSKGITSTVSAPPTPAPNAATVVRSMFTQGSRWVIIGSDVTA